MEDLTDKQLGTLLTRLRKKQRWIFNVSVGKAPNLFSRYRVLGDRYVVTDIEERITEDKASIELVVCGVTLREMKNEVKEIKGMVG